MPKNMLTDDLRIKDVRPLIPPAILIEEIPVSEKVQEMVSRVRREIADSLHGRDDRLVCVVGPCSIHDPGAALEFGQKLRDVSANYSDDLIVIMRTYFEKPRTVTGWKGLMNDPDLDETYKINKGLRMARQLLHDLAESGMPSGAEFLDNILPQYIADFIAWAAVGARTTESQIHREFASGCSMPVGFKNATSGMTRSCIDAVRAASVSHWFPSVTKQGVSAILQTAGNDSCHVILRGGSETGPNYDQHTVKEVTRDLNLHGLPARLMVDFSHGNSSKDHRRQKIVAEDVAAQIESGSDGIFGVMIESHLNEGRQDMAPRSELKYGVSVTDACISLEEATSIFEKLASAVRARRSLPRAAAAGS